MPFFKQRSVRIDATLLRHHSNISSPIKIQTWDGPAPWEPATTEEREKRVGHVPLHLQQRGRRSQAVTRTGSPYSPLSPLCFTQNTFLRSFETETDLNRDASITRKNRDETRVSSCTSFETNTLLVWLVCATATLRALLSHSLSLSLSLSYLFSPVDVIAWRKPSSAAGCRCIASPRSIHHRGDVSACIVIEWYNKGWSPWETENRATWRTIRYDVEKAARRRIGHVTGGRCHDAVNTDPVGNCRRRRERNVSPLYFFKRRRLTARFNGDLGWPRCTDLPSIFDYT